MKKQLLRKKCYMAMFALAGAVMLAAMPVAAATMNYYAIDISVQGISLEADQIFHGTAVSWVSYATSADYDPAHWVWNTSPGGSLSGDFMLDVSTHKFSITDSTNHTIQLTGDVSLDAIESTADYYRFDVSNEIGSIGDSTWAGGLPGIIEISKNGNTFVADITEFPAAPVPLPGTMSLMLVGGSALAALRRLRVSRRA